MKETTTIKLLELQKQTSTITTNKEEIESGLDFIINHFDPTILYFPRTIMTKQSNGQIVAYGRKEALQSFKQSEFQDCRINAYRYSPSFYFIEQWTPDLIFIDIDKNDFKSDRGRKLALSNTLKIIKEKLGGHPTVLFTGGGYHLYQPIEGIVFQNYNDIFNEFNNEYDLFKEFLNFSKNIFSNNKADKNNNPSLKSCLLRIPGTINSKYNSKVTIVQKWNGYRPPISEKLLEEFRTRLIQKKINEYSYRQKMMKSRRYTNNSYIIFWIEKLLKTPIADFRKNALSLILTPYLIHIKKLSYQESFEFLIEWLKRCNAISKLDFNANDQVKSALNIAIQKRIPPMKLETLKNRNLELHNKFCK